MTRALPRTTFHSSTLIRCLADLALADAAESGNAFAERLGEWMHFTDAITLSAVHGAAPENLPAVPQRPQAAARAVDEFNRLQTLLANGIAKSFSTPPGKAYLTLPTPPVELPGDLGAAYLPYRRFFEAHQRDMELSIQPLRTNVRAMAAQASPGLKKLAELDATMEKILRERERALLAKVPVWLRSRFEQRVREHRTKLGETGEADDPAAWTRPGGWLARFCGEMQMLLLAELELRLQTTLGLIEALQQDTP
ncbi:Protein of unknown function [Noviherbaspirillum humi]|uniref:DUF3348 domain-containing protein n=1 Tax=Noviherbaspirillum humi TaxID=1688639 RepID=A0A239LZ09_9BURK|nr:DUF3348 family protein [Noviherbaspirillum humi]SNT35520.1 Protein of unknown function [Noviherbaspirillum humi]